MTEEATKLLQDRVEAIQKDAHEFIDEIGKESSASYQDLMNIYLFSKIAALELHIESLTKQQES